MSIVVESSNITILTIIVSPWDHFCCSFSDILVKQLVFGALVMKFPSGVCAVLDGSIQEPSV